MTKLFKGTSKPLLIYFAILAFTGLGLGLSDSVFSNYFKEAYHVDAFQRGLIEFPRELPGLLCVVVISFLSFLGDLKTAIIAQALSLFGLLVLGISTPPMVLMLVFLFINSLGMHLYMPLNDSIGMHIAEKDKIGKRMGQYSGWRTLFSLLAAGIVFLGFKFGIFSLVSQVKVVFLLGAFCFLACFVLFILLYKQTKGIYTYKSKTKIFFKKRYTFYYILAILNGAQKQIMFVFGPWVIIELLGKKAETMALLAIVGSFIGVFFIPLVGRMIDKFGIKKLMFADAFSFIFVYIAYGLLSNRFAGGQAATLVLTVLTYALFISDRISMQFGMVKVVYLKKISETPSDVTPTLSLGISMDHVVSIICAFIGGIVWVNFGPQWVFFGAAALSLTNLVVAILVKEDHNTRGTYKTEEISESASIMP